MFCYQCEETAKGEGCTKSGVCGKKEDVANLQDLLLHLCKGISIYNVKAKDEEAYTFVMESLFSTITNANFDKQHFLKKINQAIEIRDRIKENVTINNLHDAVTWHSSDEEEILKKATQVGVLATENEDIRSLQSLLVYGLKGIAA
jgi:hydroxylamine reductase